MLNEVGIQLFVIDTEMSVLEGSANAIPRRVMVDKNDHAKALRILKDAQSEIDGLNLFDEQIAYLCKK